VLEGGEEVRAREVVSGADPRTTFLRLVDPVELPPEVVRAFQNVKLRGSRAIVSLALGERPSFPGVPAEALDGLISLPRGLDDVERAYDDAKHGGVSRRPVLEATIPSLGDPTLAPPGKHVMRVDVQYVPYRLRQGTWDEDTKRGLVEQVLARLGEVAPKLPASVVAAAVHGPRDLEARFGLCEGHLDQGELTLDQILFMRPIPGFAHYRTPIEGLWLCGAACHPGGGLPGLAGANAARELAREA
jgi:phytoene dehydrogenase-like protein